MPDGLAISMEDIPGKMWDSTSSESISAFDALYGQYHQAVYANIFRMVKRTETAKDLLQEVFLSLWENRAKIQQEQVGGWLFTVSYNKSLSHLKRELRRSEIITVQTVLSENIADHEEPDYEVEELKHVLIEKAIALLPERRKRIFTLCRLESKSYKEAAVSLGVSTETIKDDLKVSTRFIREYISEQYPGCSVMGMALLFQYIS